VKAIIRKVRSDEARASRNQEVHEVSLHFHFTSLASWCRTCLRTTSLASAEGAKAVPVRASSCITAQARMVICADVRIAICSLSHVNRSSSSRRAGARWAIPRACESFLRSTQHSAASKHLQVLFHAGLVQRQRATAAVMYRITTPDLLEWLRYLGRRRVGQTAARRSGSLRPANGSMTTSRRRG
jgi:hypothetical protein